MSRSIGSPKVVATVASRTSTMGGALSGLLADPVGPRPAPVKLSRNSGVASARFQWPTCRPRPSDRGWFTKTGGADIHETCRAEPSGVNRPSDQQLGALPRQDRDSGVPDRAFAAPVTACPATVTGGVSRRTTGPATVTGGVSRRRTTKRAAGTRSDLQTVRTQDLVEDLPRLHGFRLGENFHGQPDNLGAEPMLSPAAWSSRRTSPSGRWRASFEGGPRLGAGAGKPFDYSSLASLRRTRSRPNRRLENDEHHHGRGRHARSRPPSPRLRRDRRWVIGSLRAGFPLDDHSVAIDAVTQPAGRQDDVERFARRQSVNRSGLPWSTVARAVSEILRSANVTVRRPHGSPNPETRPVFPSTENGGAARSARHSLPFAAMGRRLIDRSVRGPRNSSRPRRLERPRRSRR